MRRIVTVVTAVLVALAVPAAAATPTEPNDAPASRAFVDAPQRYVDTVFPDIVTTTGIPFATVTTYKGAEQTLLLDLTQPVTDPTELRPAIVWMGGGSFKTLTRSSMGRWTNPSARLGYVAVTIDYRVRPDLDLTNFTDVYRASIDAMHDAQAAVRWLRANAATYRIDPDRIMVGGYSAGAITSLWVNFGGDTPEVDGPNPGYPSHVNGAISLAGAFGAKPIAGDPPIVMFHGIYDTTVPYFIAKSRCDTQLAVGNVCEWHEYPTAHGLPWDTVIPIAFDFAYRHMTCGERFSDVTPLPHQFCPDIDWLVTNEIAGGYPDGTYRPTESIRRQHLISMLWRMAGAPTGAPDPGFLDVPPSSPFAEAIAWAVDAGVASGYPDGRFRPAADVTRQTGATMLWSFLGRPEPAGAPSFTDVPPDHPFATPIAWVEEAGIVSGFGDGTFQPLTPVSRQTAAAQLHAASVLIP